METPYFRRQNPQNTFAPGLRALGEWDRDIRRGMRDREQDNRTRLSRRTWACSDMGDSKVEAIRHQERDRDRWHHLYSMIWPESLCYRRLSTTLLSPQK